VKERQNEHLDHLIRGSLDSLDWRFQRLPRSRGADPLVACIRGNLTDFAFCAGQADCLKGSLAAIGEVQGSELQRTGWTIDRARAGRRSASPIYMSRENDFGRITKGAITGLVAGLVGSWAANQFHSVWSKLKEEEQNPEVARLSDRGGRPDTAAAKEKVAAGEPAEEDATVAIASKVSSSVLDRPLTRKEKHQAGVAVHYTFGAASGAFYGAIAEVAPLAKIANGVGFGIWIWLAAVEVALPALKLTQPPWHYPFRMHAYSFISHLVYGTVTEQVRKTLRSAL
jgi:Protein of unknown function (DUF1440)